MFEHKTCCAQAEDFTQNANTRNKTTYVHAATDTTVHMRLPKSSLKDDTRNVKEHVISGVSSCSDCWCHPCTIKRTYEYDWRQRG